MSLLPDDTRLADISIPGTHNSMSLYGGHLPQTQTLSIRSQLDMGIRYLDARFKYQNGELHAYHGDFPQYQTFDELVNTVYQFLTAYPSETVLIRMQNEAGASTDKDAFYRRFNEIQRKYGDKNIRYADENTPIRDLRGKFVFIRDFYTAGDTIGIDRSFFKIQDEYHMTTNWDLYSKWEKIKKHLSDIQRINYLSMLPFGLIWLLPLLCGERQIQPRLS